MAIYSLAVIIINTMHKLATQLYKLILSAVLSSSVAINKPAYAIQFATKLYVYTIASYYVIIT